MIKTTHVLLVLDGWGIGKEDGSNPIYTAHPPTIEFIRQHFPSGALHASGLTVGLPWKEAGNSEVGHLTLGAGKTIFQYFPRISLAVQKGDFFTNPALLGAFHHARSHQSTVHLIGLLSEENVHASREHLFALIDMARKESCASLSLHLFSDGVDSAPQQLRPLLLHVQKYLGSDGVISSIIGRHYAMNRNEEWQKTESAYRLFTSPEAPSLDWEENIARSYAKNINDEFIGALPLPGRKHIQSGDAVIFFNFREDSMQQIITPFVGPSFPYFSPVHFENIYIATMTDYIHSPAIHVAFPPEKNDNSLGKVLADHNKTQLRIAETEKYAHVTYFFNGLQEEPFPNEYRILVPSENISHHETHPEMMAGEITNRVCAALDEGIYDFILVNFANADIIAHTSDFKATEHAISFLDRCIKRIMDKTLSSGHALLITGDHGNAETLLNLHTGKKESIHNTNPVPFYLVATSFQNDKPITLPQRLPIIGMLSDVAPTILHLMHIPVPQEMTGQNLLEQLI